MTGDDAIAAAGLRLVAAVDFEFADDVHPRTAQIVALANRTWGLQRFICYTPNADGYMLLGDARAELAAEAIADHPPAAQMALF